MNNLEERVNKFRDHSNEIIEWDGISEFDIKDRRERQKELLDEI